MVCESDPGYICELMIYDVAGMTLHNTALELLCSYLGLCYKVYLDNYYNSVALSELLHEQKMLVCGTIRQNRGLSRDLRSPKNIEKCGNDILKGRQNPTCVMSGQETYNYYLHHALCRYDLCS
jgi:hypothetical protein